MTGFPEIAPVDAATYAAFEDRFARLLGVRRDLLLVQGEAVVPLEAVARSVGRRGSRAVNVVTGHYGAVFGDQLRSEGVQVDDIAVPFDRAVRVEEVATALERLDGADLVCLVHAEAATGVLNPLAEIAALARAAGALVVVDAVASVGADPLEIDAWDLDAVVLSAQKALAGPSGVSAVALSDRAWEWIESNGAAPRQSVLSLLDLRERWLRAGRTSLPSIPHHAEMRQLEAALANVEAAGGIAGSVDLHAAARRTCRDGVRAHGGTLWVAPDADATAVATTIAVPAGVRTDDAVAAARAADPAAGALLAPAPWMPDEAIRVSHTGRAASVELVERALTALFTDLVKNG